jgi:hypothetical protein
MDRSSTLPGTRSSSLLQSVMDRVGESGRTGSRTVGEHWWRWTHLDMAGGTSLFAHRLIGAANLPLHALSGCSDKDRRNDPHPATIESRLQNRTDSSRHPRSSTFDPRHQLDRLVQTSGTGRRGRRECELQEGSAGAAAYSGVVGDCGG